MQLPRVIPLGFPLPVGTWDKFRGNDAVLFASHCSRRRNTSY